MIALQARGNEKDKKAKGKWPVNSKWNFKIMVEENFKIQRTRLIKRVREVSIKMVDMATLEVEILEVDEEEVEVTKSLCNTVIVKGSVILQVSARRTRMDLN